MELPSSVLLGQTLKPGTIYLMDDNIFNNGLPHYVVVINKDILKDSSLFLIPGTSKIDKRKLYVNKMGLSLKTLVITNPTECKFLSCPTVFDCNGLLERTIDEIEDKSNNGQIRAIYNINEDLLKKIRDGVVASRLIPNRIKKCLL